MKRRKRLTSILLSAALLLGLTGCGNTKNNNIIFDASEHGDGEQIELTFYGFKEGAWNVMAIEEALSGFMDLHPNVFISYEGLESAEYWDLLEKRAASGNLDDVFMVDHDHVLSMSAEGRLADLSDLSTLPNYGDTAQSQFPKEGHIYFLPTCISTYGLFVNLDLLEKHGQAVPTDLASFSKVCDYFVSQGITPIIGNNYSSLRCLMAAKGLYPVYQTEDPGAEIQTFNDGTADLAETLRPGLELVSSMLEKGWFDAQAVLNTTETWGDTAEFLKGEQPFMVTGGWTSPTIDEGDPDFSYAVYPFPILDSGSVLVQDVNTCISVSGESPHLDVAKEFVEYLTQTDVMWAYCDNQSSFTPLKDDRIPSNQALSPSVPYLTNGRSVIGSDYHLEKPIDAAQKAAGDALLEGKSVEEAYEILAETLSG